MTSFITQYWIGAAFGFTISLFGFLYKALHKRVKEELVEQNSLRLGVQALLRDRIIQAYNDYMDKGYCPIYARENIEALYLQYHELGGNGTITGLIENMKTLPYEREDIENEE